MPNKIKNLDSPITQIVNVVRHIYNGCRKVRAKGIHLKGFSMLPKGRTELPEPFHTTGVDFARPLLYEMGTEKGSKAYAILKSLLVLQNFTIARKAGALL